ncbi:MAG: hypothetical protein ACOCVF_00975 [bacterium]
MRDQVEKIINDWLETGNENTTFLAHEICILLKADVRYFKCFKCGSKIMTTNNENGDRFVCIEPVPFRTSGICGGIYSIEITEKEYNDED